MKNLYLPALVSLFMVAACTNQEVTQPAAADAAPVVTVQPTPPAPQTVTPTPEPAPAPAPEKTCKVSDEEARKQEIDEQMASAAKPELALSDFYKEPENAAIFAFSLDFARNKAQPLYLGLLEDRPCYQEGPYYAPPDKLQVFREMRAYHQINSVKYDPRILAVIDRKLGK